MSQPKIALFDIETAPSLGYFWGRLWQTDIIQVESPWYMLCFSYKWLGEKTIHTHALPDYHIFRRDKHNDLFLLKDLRNLFDKADILIAHNGDRFDIKKANARFIYHKFRPPSSYKTIDTCKAAKRYFKFDSNRLDALGRYLGLGKKRATTGFDLWKRCMAGDSHAWDEMIKYNQRDVKLLEDVYTEMRPYMENHPDTTIYDKIKGCPVCRSQHIVSNGFRFARSRKYTRLHCMGCGHWFKGEQA